MKQLPILPPSFYRNQSQVFQIVSPVQTNAPSFRKQYPFLADPDCPHELKILATQKLTAYNNYVTAHTALFNCSNLQQSFHTVKQLVENYLDNQQIFEELNHYKLHKQVLGKHPVFKEYQQLRELRALNPIELAKEQERVQHNIWRIEQQISKKDKPHLQVEREKRLTLKRNRLSEITRLIDAYKSSYASNLE